MKHAICLLTLVLLAGCGGGGSKADSSAVVHHVSVAEFKDLIEAKEGVLVDIRTPQEFNQGHIEGAKLVDFKAPDFLSEMGQFDKDVPLLIYCRTGRRSGIAADQLEGLGFKHVYNLKDGITAWRAES